MTPAVGEVGRSVTVTGTGTAGGDPDLAVVHLRADVLRPTAQQAVAACDDCVHRVRRALAATGLADTRADSTDLSLHAEDTWGVDPATGQNVHSRNGFRASHGLRVTMRDMRRLGEILGALLAAGSDELALDRVAYSFADPGALRNRARTRAWDDARSRAEQHASSAGAALGQVLQVAEDAAGAPQPMETMRAQALSSVEPGSIDVAVHVTVRWELT